jgi:hypothetical protein
MLIAGSLMIAFIVVMAVVHYAIGIPVYDRNTGHIVTSDDTLRIFALFCGAGAFGISMGALVRRLNVD